MIHLLSLNLEHNTNTLVADLSIESVKQDFDNYLSGKSAERVIFSAPFGSGKTYFLNRFFDSNEKYEAIILRPVNYAVASNEDIFELLKHDILFELLKETDLEFDKLSLDFVLATRLYSETNFIEILKPFVFAIPGLGKTIKEISKPFEELFNKVKDYKRKVEIDQKSEIISFLREISQEKGSIYESDFTTGTICQLVDQLKGKDKKVKTVLVIDDLDRIDPAHLFRLLNVFAAHFDEDKNSNKFGFDHLVFVCDINNINRIYESFYGTGVDFAGYINKFYSKEIFEFDNTKILINTVDGWLSSVEAKNLPSGFNLFTDQSIVWRKWLTFALVRMIQSKKLSLRTLRSQVLRSFNFKIYSVSVYQGKKNRNIQFSWFILFDFLKSLFGNDLNSLTVSISESNFSNSLFEEGILDDLEWFIGDLLVLVDSRSKPLKSETFEVTVENKKIQYEVNVQNDYITGRVKQISKTFDWTIDQANYNYLIKEAFKIYLHSSKRQLSK